MTRTQLTRSIALASVASLLMVGSAAAQSGWFRQNPLPQVNYLTSVSFTDASTGTAVGDQGTIVRTNTGGATP